jgi:hypothetical protein
MIRLLCAMLVAVASSLVSKGAAADDRLHSLETEEIVSSLPYDDLWDNRARCVLGA